MVELKSYTLKTDQGPYLQVNEDNVHVDLPNKLFMVIDGFGGTGVGDKAAETVQKKMCEFYTKIGGDPDSTLPFYHSKKYLLEGNALVNAIYSAHDYLKSIEHTKEIDKRGGASGIFACMSENILTVAGVGNCLGLLIRNGLVHSLFIPDDFRLYALDGQISHFYTLPMSGFALFDDIHFSIKESRIKEGDRYLFLTDGVYSRLAVEKDILPILEGGRPDLEKVELMFQRANDRGNLDNQSALLLNF